MRFFESGRAFDRMPERPMMKRVKAFLDGVRDGELLSAHQVSAATMASLSSIRSDYKPWVEYSVVHGRKKWFGNKKTIREFKKSEERDAKRRRSEIPRKG